MGETANTIPPGGYKNLTGLDWLKGIGYALFGNITALILFAISQDHFPTWPELQPYIVTTVTTLLGYIGKNYFTNNEGKMFKQDGPIVAVPAKELEKVIDKAVDKENEVKNY